MTPDPTQDYENRVRQELASFADCVEVHDLPEAYEQWAARYLLPEFQRMGFEDVIDAFVQACVRTAAGLEGRPLEVLSIGAGNCDTEVELARRLRERGLPVRIRCLEINGAMRERGRVSAEREGLSDQVLPEHGDFNTWLPEERSLDVVLANQVLHHVVELEHLYDAVRRGLRPHGRFVASDMIGRNGHMRWPEAERDLQAFWSELPEAFRYNRVLERHEPRWINHDCSLVGFEGIRAQEVLPLLLPHFHFEQFLPFACLSSVFLDRPFGHHFDLDREWDRNFIDRVHAHDEASFLSRRLRPTQMIASMTLEPLGATQLRHPRLTPQACVRRPRLSDGLHAWWARTRLRVLKEIGRARRRSSRRP